MQHQDLLLTTAEVSAAFAGFSGIVGVFRFAAFLTIRGITRDHTFTQVGLASVRTTHVIAWVTTIMVGLSILNGLGVFSSRASAVYLVALFWTLGLSGFFFTRLVASSQAPSQDEE